MLIWCLIYLRLKAEVPAHLKQLKTHFMVSSQLLLNNLNSGNLTGVNKAVLKLCVVLFYIIFLRKCGTLVELQWRKFQITFTHMNESLETTC